MGRDGERLRRQVDAGGLAGLVGVPPRDDDGRALEQLVEEALGTWVEEDGSMAFAIPAPPPGVLAMMAGRWHIALSRLRWQVITLAPLLLANVLVHRGLSPTDLHGLLSALENVVRALSDEELAVATRLVEQDRAFDGATLADLQVGLSAGDQAAVAALVERLEGDGVVRRDAAGRFHVVT